MRIDGSCYCVPGSVCPNGCNAAGPCSPVGISTQHLSPQKGWECSRNFCSRMESHVKQHCGNKFPTFFIENYFVSSERIEVILKIHAERVGMNEFGVGVSVLQS